MVKNQNPFLTLTPKRLVKKETVEVYDIEIPEDHSFVLENGAIAHNCSHSISYGYITYATMFLRHYYPLEFWTAVLSNADKKEIKEKYYKHVRNVLAPPDINLSSDDMTIDYQNKKIRSKLTIIKGLSGAGMTDLLSKRPFLSLSDLVCKKAVKPAMTRKLIIVGVMDSLFPPGLSLIEKLQMYEDEVEIAKYNEKITQGKKVKEIKKGKVDPEYLSLSPLDEYKLKKEILPTMEISISDIVADISPRVKKGPSGKFLFEGGRRDYAFVDGEIAEKIDKKSKIENKYGVEYCVAAHVMSKKEFSYSGGKKALKLIIDTDGYNRETVLWPDYNTGQLTYPSFKEGDVVVLLMKKREGKDSNVQRIYVDFL